MKWIKIYQIHTYYEIYYEKAIVLYDKNLFKKLFFLIRIHFVTKIHKNCMFVQITAVKISFPC